jgi:hypothetical protein
VSERDRALEWAGSVRSKRSEVVAALGAGDLSLAELFEQIDADSEIGHIRLLTVLEAFPGARKIDTRRRLAEHALDGTTQLSDIDRAAVLAVFGGPK